MCIYIYYALAFEEAWHTPALAWTWPLVRPKDRASRLVALVAWNAAAHAERGRGFGQHDVPSAGPRGARQENECGSKLNRRGRPQVLVHVSTYQGNPFWHRFFEPQPNGKGKKSLGEVQQVFGECRLCEVNAL